MRSLRRRAQRIVLDGHLAVTDSSPDAVYAVVDSLTTAGYHAVRWRPDGWHCDCEGFRYRRRCVHVESVKIEIRRRGLQARNTNRRRNE